MNQSPQQADIETSIVFKALLRSPTFFGVDYDYFLITLGAVVIIFIYANSFMSLLLYLPLHAIGFLLQLTDPHIFKLLSVRSAIGTIKNKALWKCQSYEPY